MSRRYLYSFGGVALFFLWIWTFSNLDEGKEEFPEIVKIALREVGNRMLLADNDSTSLVLPVVLLSESRFRLSFGDELEIDPDSLVKSIKKSFRRSSLPRYYRVQVVQCADQEIAYSYEIMDTEDLSIIPCSGRILGRACYEIEVKFTRLTPIFLNRQTLLFIPAFIVLALVAFGYYNKTPAAVSRASDTDCTAVGSYLFYPEQNKLVRETVEISLSKKECELLAIFVAHPNQVVKRDELTKKVWEDNGVFVSRSLDTYISKLRKKLQDDDTIKISNVHGVGYRLELKS